MSVSWIKKIGLGILILILSVTINEVYGKTLHTSSQLNYLSISNKNLEKEGVMFSKSLDLDKTFKLNTSYVVGFKILESDLLFANKGLLVKASKVKRKSHKLGKANVSHLLLNNLFGILEKENYSIPYRETSIFENYQRVCNYWYTIEITPD